MEFFLASSSPDSSSDTFGRSTRSTDCELRCELALRQLARLVEIPRPEISIEAAKADADRLIGETSKSFDQARRYIVLTQFESEESSATDQVSTSKLENILVRAEEIFASAKSLVQGDERQDQTRTALLSEITAEVQRLN